VGAREANPSGKLNAGKSYVVFGKQDNTDAIELIWVSFIGTHNQIIQAIAVDIACAGD
jgi:hypothetical protein